MKRRAFVSQSSVAVAGIATVSGIACSKETANKQGTGVPSASNDDFELNETTIRALQENMASGKYTSAAITDIYLKRIEAIDKNGPKLNAVIELNPDALAIAKSMDEERKAGKIRGPLHGIPVLIKENINTADQMVTTAGSLALANHIASQD
ncbi:MAG TPA: amidase family protein, partial [Saprospiraceae bacterium]|nr:amidase family protein [Saprospiraceae bacterium]